MVPADRAGMVNALLKEFEFNYRAEFLARNGFDLDDTKDPKLLKFRMKKNQRELKKSLKWRYRFTKLANMYDWVRKFLLRHKKTA